MDETIDNIRDRSPHEHALYIIGQLIRLTAIIRAKIRRGENINNTPEWSEFQDTYQEVIIHTTNMIDLTIEDHLINVNEPIKATIQAIKIVNKLKKGGFYRVDHKPLILI